MKKFDIKKWGNNPREMWVWDEHSKPEKWYVLEDNFITSESSLLKFGMTLENTNEIFTGTEEECRKYVDDNTYVVDANSHKIWLKDDFYNTYSNRHGANDIVYEGSKMQCEEWVKEHTVTLSDIGLDDKPKYRPFKDCDELIETFRNKVERKYRLIHCENNLELSTIWIRDKDKNEYMIVSYCNGHVNCIHDGIDKISMKALFNNYTFLDGSVVGVKE